MKIFENNAKALEDYISAEQFERYYEDLRAGRLPSTPPISTNDANLLEHVKFAIRSGDITPVIPGYVRIDLGGSGSLDTHLIGYMPEGEYKALGDTEHPAE